MIKSLDSRLVLLKKTDHLQFEKEMTLQKEFNNAARYFCNDYFDSGSGEGNLALMCFASCFGDLYTYRDKQAKQINQSKLHLNTGTINTSYSADYFDKFSQDLCVSMPNSVWMAKAPPDNCKQLVMKEIESNINGIAINENDGDVCAYFGELNLEISKAAIVVPQGKLSEQYAPEMVRLPSGISIGKYEVTIAQWRAVMGDRYLTDSDCMDDNCPVEHVSWNETQNFISQINQRTGKHYRLPTDNEWYTACQAGGSHAYCGSDSIDAVTSQSQDCNSEIQLVGRKEPNAYGLYDIGGNAGEWTSSCLEDDCSRRIFRGCVKGKSYLRYGYGLNVKNLRDNFLGFRLIQD